MCGDEVPAGRPAPDLILRAPVADVPAILGLG